MIAIKGNIFAEDKLGNFVDNINSKDQKKERTNASNVCDFCFSQFQLSEIYHYCYYCSIFYCTKCLELYKKTDKKKIELHCMNHSIFKEIDSP